MNPKFSVIIPSYNHEKYVGGAIESVLNQTLEDWELIVVDDGSLDNSVEITKNFNDPRIKLFTQDNHDAPYTINRGMKEARGEYFAILNSDDLFEPLKLEKCQEALASGESDFVFGKIKTIDENGRPMPLEDERVQWIEKRLNNPKTEHTLDTLLLNINYYLTTSNFVFSRKLFQEVGSFHEKLHYSHDFDFLLRIFGKNLKMEFIPEYLTDYRLHSDNTISKGRNESHLESSYAIARLLRNRPDFSKKYTPDFFQLPVFSNALRAFASLTDSEMEEAIENKESPNRKKIIEIIERSLDPNSPLNHRGCASKMEYRLKRIWSGFWK